jgi:hypothetical protein
MIIFSHVRIPNIYCLHSLVRSRNMPREHHLIIVLRCLISPAGTRSGEIMPAISPSSEALLLGVEEAETLQVKMESLNLSS